MDKNTFRNSDKVIVCMGLAGAGRSSIIDHLTQHQPTWAVGISLKDSREQNIRVARVPAAQNAVTKDDSLVLVDTPACAPGDQGDVPVLDKVRQWLEDTYKEGKPTIAGVLYVQNIKIYREPGVVKPTASALRKNGIKGDRTILVTTHWDGMDQAKKENIEREMQGFATWARMLGQGARLSRFDNKQQSAWDIITPLLEPAVPASPTREELAHLKNRLSINASGTMLAIRTENVLGKIDEVDEAIRKAQTEERAQDDIAVANLKQRKATLEGELDKHREQISKRGISWPRRIWDWLTGR